jgi:hypothetical protein
MEKRKFVLNIHSVSSVITNSSEMIYVVDDGKTEKEILEILEPFIQMDREEGNSSGNGGCVEVYGPEDDDDRVILMIDWSMENTCNAVSDIFNYKTDN